MRYLIISILLLFIYKDAISQIQNRIPIFEKNNFISGNLINNIKYDSDTTIDIKYYKLNLQIKLNPDNLIGEVTINGIFKIPSQNSFYLDLSNNMNVDSVKQGSNLLNFIHNNNVIYLTVNNFSNNFSVIIYYHGIPNPSGYGSFIFGSNNSSPVIWSLSEPFGASDWFPCKNTPSDKVDSSDVWINCPGNLTGVSNGKLIETTLNNDSTKTYKWHNSYPIAHYLLSVAVTNYSIYKNYFKYSPTDSMPVVHYIYPEVIDSLKPTLGLTVNMLGIFSNKYGLYPFINEKYGHAQFGEQGGMEHQTITSIGVINEYIIAHELTHQWFGDKITCKDWHNIWLNEGFATYGECIYVENTYGHTAFENYLAQKITSAKRAKGTIYVQNISSISEIFDANRSYAKGSLVLHMLRGIAGDSTFFNILRAYTSDTSVAYKTAATEDFQRIAERVSGLQLGYFFQEWIYGENYPLYNLKWSYTQGTGDLYNISLTLTQNQNTYPIYFTMPFNVKINTDEGDTVFNFFNNALNQTFNFTLKGKPVLLTFDPDNFILKDKFGDEPFEIVSYSLSQNYPNPFNPNTTINYTLGGFVQVKVTVYDVLGKTVVVLVNAKQQAGSYVINFSSHNLSSGVYFYKIDAGNFTNVKKMVVLH